MRKDEFKYLGVDIPLVVGMSLHVCIGHNLNDVYAATNIAGNPIKGYEPDRWGAIAFEADREDNYGVFVFLRPDATPKVVAHEAVHLTNYVFAHIGHRLDVKNDEMQAYMTGWIVEQMHEALTSKDIKPAKTIALR